MVYLFFIKSQNKEETMELETIESKTKKTYMDILIENQNRVDPSLTEHIKHLFKYSCLDSFVGMQVATNDEQIVFNIKYELEKSTKDSDGVISTALSSPEGNDYSFNREIELRMKIDSTHIDIDKEIVFPENTFIFYVE